MGLRTPETCLFYSISVSYNKRSSFLPQIQAQDNDFWNDFSTKFRGDACLLQYEKHQISSEKKTYVEELYTRFTNKKFRISNSCPNRSELVRKKKKKKVQRTFKLRPSSQLFGH